MSPEALLVAVIVGVAAFMFIYGARGWFVRKWERDQAWVESTWARFHVEKVDIRTYTIGYYVCLLAVLAVFMLFIPNAFIAVGLWLCTLLLPPMIVNSMWQRRRKKIDAQLALSISTMCNSIRAGLTLVQAVQRLAETAPEPIRTEFKIMANQYSFGADMEQVITTTKERLNLPNFNLFASALLLNREMGGDIAATLGRIAQSLDRLKQMKATVEAHTSEGRTNIKVLLVAPVFMLLMLWLVDPSGVEVVFTTPQGWGILLLAGVLALTGVYFASRITRTEV